MKVFDFVKNAFWGWLDRVGEAMIAAIVRLTGKSTVRLVEGEDGRVSVISAENGETDPHDSELRLANGSIAGRPSSEVETALRGGRVELLLRPQRFVFKPLELPSRAAEFLDGVVRSQIDRLTPWSADDAAFGFSPPADAGSGRIGITVAATAKEMLVPFLQALTALGARSVSILAQEAAPDAPAINILQQNVGVLDLHFARRILLAVLATAFLVAVTANIAAAILDGGLQAHQDALARRISQIRAAALLARNTPGDPKTLAERSLAQRKNDSPSTVIALEILSQILPDDTYLTELRIETDKLRLSGFTSDAPRLIRLIEQTSHFSQATFYAPITRSSSNPRDRFNIEAHMKPDFSLTP